VAVRITNLVKGLITLGDPINDTLQGEEIKEYRFVEYDSLVNDRRFVVLTKDFIQIDNLDPGGYYDSIWSGPNRFKLDQYHIWVDASGRVRIKFGNATFTDDGDIVGPQEQTRLTGLDTTAMSQYLAAFISNANVATPIDCSAATGSDLKATFAGVYSGLPGILIASGRADVKFDAALAPPPAAGEIAFLSYTTAGQFTNVAPLAGSGAWSSRGGIILDHTTYGTTQTCTILIQPSAPIHRV
jgi:hypothetical protein